MKIPFVVLFCFVFENLLHTCSHPHLVQISTNSFHVFYYVTVLFIMDFNLITLLDIYFMFYVVVARRHVCFVKIYPASEW